MEEDIKSASTPTSRARTLWQPTESGFWQMIRFAMVGAVATVVDYAVLLSLYEYLHVSHIPAVAAGYAAGLLVCYVLSIAWIFPHRNITDKRVEFAVFMIIGAIGLVLTEIVVDVTLRLMDLSPGLSARMTGTTRIIVAKMIAIVIVFFFNFWARKAVMFRHPGDRRK